MTGPDYPRLVNRDQPLPTLAFLIDGHLAQLLDPSADRWRDA
jgi:hypothetical protein